MKSEDYSYQRSRTLLQATRNLYKGDALTFNLGAAYRNESYSTKKGNSKNGNNSYWLIPSGNYKFTDSLAFNFWDTYYFYDNTGELNTTEWEGEHGLQYKFSDDFSGKLTFYHDVTWGHNGSKKDAEYQIRGYFPIKLSSDWEVQPYFRYVIDKKEYDSKKNYKLKNEVKNAGFRLGTLLTYKLSEQTSLWANYSYERTEWKNSKNSADALKTYGNDNLQDIRIYAIGVRHAW
ncbi:MAG: OmpG family monomeric porin [Enterobacteriaceae bacterium]